MLKKIFVTSLVAMVLFVTVVAVGQGGVKTEAEGLPPGPYGTYTTM